MSAVPPNHSKRVVAVHVDLDVVVAAATADALERDAVQLVVRAELDAGELDAHVAQRAAVVVRVVAAIDAGIAFAGAFAARDVHRRAAVDDEAAPVAARARADRLIAGEHDRLLARADRIQPSAALDDQRADAAGFANHSRSGLDVQRGAVADEDRAAEHVVVVVGPGLGPGDFAGDDDDRLVDARHVDRRRLIRRDVRDSDDGQHGHERRAARLMRVDPFMMSRITPERRRVVGLEDGCSRTRARPCVRA